MKATISSDDDPAADYSRLAVAIPCYNEAAAIATVVRSWREALPGIEVVVFDNNSTDGTGAIAREAGARVVEVPERGKGHAVRAIFGELADRRLVILVDGDGTYPADAVGPLVNLVLRDRADMVVGARRPVDQPGAMTPVRGLGNRLIRLAFRVLIGPGPGDLLSGYRVFGPRFLAEVRPRASGFEIEAELASEAVARGLRTIEVPVPYHPRIAGTTSKLRAFRDGGRIVAMLLKQGVRHRPWRAIGLLLAVAVAVAVVVVVAS